MTCVAIIEPQLREHVIARKVIALNQRKSTASFGKQACRPDIVVAEIALAINVVVIDSIVWLATCRTPQLCERIQLKGKTRVTSRHDRMRCEFVFGAEMAGQA